jgi:hypothetical protein
LIYIYMYIGIYIYIYIYLTKRTYVEKRGVWANWPEHVYVKKTNTVMDIFL